MMHRCLHVDELLREICQTVLHSYPEDQQTLNTGDLARLARVCHQFKDPALDTLWSAQDTIGPLLLCTPTDMRYVDSKSLVKLSRTSRPSDWDRVKAYGRRIRCVGNPQFPVGSFPFRQARPILPDSAILEAMLDHCAIEDVFPNLLAFDFMSAVGYRCVNTNFHSLKHFLTPMLRQLSFSVFSRVSLEFVQYIIDSLQLRCPDIELLSISFSYRFPPASLRIPDGVLHSLRALSLPFQDVHLSSETLAKLAASPRMRKLSCGLDDAFDAQAFARAHGTPASCLYATPQARFSGLEHLSIRASRLEQCTDFLGGLHMPNLEGLQVQFSAAHTPSAGVDFTSIRAACPNSASLRSLSVVRVISTMEDILPTVSPAAFAPLFAFRNLKNVHIANVGNFDMTDAFVADAAAAWPALEELAFVSSIPGAPRLSLRALVPLARHCRNLKRLFMPFDGTVITHEELSVSRHEDDAIPDLEVSPLDDDSEAGDADPGPQYVLRELNVGSTPISSPVDVAMFIFGLFPWTSIRVIPLTEQMDESWKRAITHFRVMQGKDAPDTPL